jgi:hypothetical protein
MAQNRENGTDTLALYSVVQTLFFISKTAKTVPDRLSRAPQDGKGRLSTPRLILGEGSGVSSFDLADV